MDEAPKSRVLMKDGEWLVPPEERPLGWERLGLSEPAPPPAPQEQVAEVVADVAAQCQVEKPPEKPPQKPRKQKLGVRAFREIDAAIHASGREAGADDRLVFAVRVLFAGMWTRNRFRICRMLTGDSYGRATEIERIGKRLTDAGIWHENGHSIRIGPLTKRCGYDLQIWLSGMVGTGEINGRWDGKEMQFQSRLAA